MAGNLLSVEMNGSVMRRLGGASTGMTNYGPFGFAPLTGCRSAFNGQWAEPAGRYALGNGYRTYLASMLRFSGADALSPFNAGGTNAYAYAIADPINRLDPTGHFSLSSALRSLFGRSGRSVGQGRAAELVDRASRTGPAVFMGNGMAVGFAPKKHRLVIQGHGNTESRMQITGPGSERHFATATEVHELLRNDPAVNGWLAESRSIELIMCYGAGTVTPGPLPFAQDLANNSGLRVKAYRGPVIATTPEPYDNWFEHIRTRAQVKNIELPWVKYSDQPESPSGISEYYKPRYFKPA
ncbi:RHS repeat-associated core domain-containing protein [Pseudomonas typographi]|uniref:RHS repeat-associated core domain-containing protein n=1 Tax=Pseudomonas typographi TaxID=2715964 RepID=A0ABR7Z1F5_9PSED|nr:RHS repeat-associated core domain-containing protein [Pseudomonas typographi]MBD1599234.1 hypothetical protein [Pseudomonas typographi]